MSDFITLGCPSCGGNLALTSDAELFACPYCRRRHLVRRADGNVSLVPIVEKLERMAEQVDRHASEMAIHRLREDRRKLKDRIRLHHDRIKNFKLALEEAELEFGPTANQSVISFVLAVLTGCLSLGLLLTGAEGQYCSIWLGSLLLVGSAVLGIRPLALRLGRIERTGWVADAKTQIDQLRFRLNELNAELDRIEDELKRHAEIVRR